MEAKKAVNGFLNLYKEPGPTSMDAVRRLKRLTGQRKRVGHGGTLDPIAEGVLPICFGQATRLMEYVTDSARAYRMDVHLGVATTTYDGEGEVVRTADSSHVDREAVEGALDPFRGEFEQTPPMYSALKVGGKRLYDLARSGIEVERKPRTVSISKMEIVEVNLPSLVIDVSCGRGAYMRSLAHDLGEALGCGAYLEGLVRLRSGPFLVEDSVRLETLLDPAEEDSWRRHLKPPDFVLLHMKSITVGEAAERYLRNGHPVKLPPHLPAYAGYMERYRAYSEDGRFLAVVRYERSRNEWQPNKVFAIDTPSPHAGAPPGNGTCT